MGAQGPISKQSLWFGKSGSRALDDAEFTPRTSKGKVPDPLFMKPSPGHPAEGSDPGPSDAANGVG